MVFYKGYVSIVINYTILAKIMVTAFTEMSSKIYRSHIAIYMTFLPFMNGLSTFFSTFYSDYGVCSQLGILITT